MRALLRRHIVLLFVVLTYAWAWSVQGPAALAVHGLGGVKRSAGALTLAGFAPTVVALALIGLTDGRRGLRDVWSRLRKARISPWWYLAAIGAPLGAIGLTVVVLPLVGAAVPQFQAWYTPLVAVAFLIPLTGFFEEVGWRGLMLDRLQARMSPLAATILVATAWGLWHFPMYARQMSEGARTPVLFAWFVAGTFPLSVIFTWLYNRTGRRLLPVIVLHASIDAGASYFYGPLPPGELRPFYLWVTILVLVAAVLLHRDGALGALHLAHRGDAPTRAVSPESPGHNEMRCARSG